MPKSSGRLPGQGATPSQVEPRTLDERDNMRAHPSFRQILFVLLATVLGCGGGGGGGSSQAPPATVQVSVSPTSASLLGGADQLFTAAVTGSTDPSVTWTVDGFIGGNAQVGTLAGTGTSVHYTAPILSGTHLVSAVSSADPTKGAAATVSVQSQVAILLNPTSISLNIGGTAALAASVTGTANTAVSWFVDGIPSGNASVGTVTGSTVATYSASSTAGTHALMVVSAADPSRSASCTVTILAPTSATLTLSPAAISMSSSNTCTFTATLVGGSNPAVTWDVDGIPSGNAVVGLLSGTGATVTYTAPGSPGSHTLTATSVADGTLRSSATITVLPPVTVMVSLTPSGSANLTATGSIWLTAAVSGSANTGVTWSVDGFPGGNASTGVLTGTGSQVQYTAPPTAGVHTITATSVADPRGLASLTITVLNSCAPAPSSSLVVNVKSPPYNATGNGVTDDTQAIQKAINAVAGTGGTVTVPAGTYLINPVVNDHAGIRVGGGMTLSLDPSTILQARPTSTSDYVVVLVSGVQNANVTGGTIIGNRNNNTITDTVEAGFGLEIVNSANIVIQGTTAKQCWADGFYVGVGSSNITLCNVVADGNRRDGLSITSVNGILVTGSTFQNTTGFFENGNFTNGFGIDVEPNSGQTVANAQILDCVLSGNASCGLTAGPPTALTGLAFLSNLVVAGNSVTGNGTQPGGAGITITNTSGHQITGNLVAANLGDGIYLSNSADNNLVTGNTVTGTLASAPPGDIGYGILLYLTGGNTVTGNTVTGSAACGIRDAYPNGANIITPNTLSGNNPDTCH